MWYLAVIGLIFASAAARSCAEFMRDGPYPAGDPSARLFAVSAILAGGPVVLALFRLWRGARGEAWPAVGLCARLAGLGALAAAVGFAGALTMALYVPLRWRSAPVGNALVVLAASGFVVALGAVQLLVIGAVSDGRTRRSAA